MEALDRLYGHFTQQQLAAELDRLQREADAQSREADTLDQLGKRTQEGGFKTIGEYIAALQNANPNLTPDDARRLLWQVP
jgi:hypothetical protein